MCQKKVSRNKTIGLLKERSSKVDYDVKGKNDSPWHQTRYELYKTADKALGACSPTKSLN